VSYVDRHLAPDERVVYRTRYHPVVFGGAVWFAAVVFGIVALIVHRNELPRDTVTLMWLVGLGVAASGFVTPFVRWRTSEFAVTTARVVAKTGFLSSHTAELLLPKVEAIEVDQSLAGRLLGYGTIRLVGTGGTDESFGRVGDPDGLRAAVLEQAPRPARRRADR
jgi:uncharacterized membrane protein YdbT with pleckstrin-like domain